jgi:transposase
VRRLIDRFADRAVLRVCYEAGPTGFGLYRLLASMGVACEVVAPSLVRARPGIGSRPTGATVAGWPGCTGPGS